MSLKDHISKISTFPGGKGESTVLTKGHELVKKRIFVDGLDALNRQIGAYSDRYDQLRASKGLPTGRVVLHFTGQMRDNFILKKTQSGYASTFPDNFAAQKAGWNEKRYGEVFDLSDDELDFIENNLAQELAKWL